MIKIFKQTIRGIGTLPHVGEHPGTGMVIFLILITGLAGAQKGGWFGFMVASAFALIVYGPMYLWGAYDRAQTSDRIEKSKG